ncbi:hypothetical protein LR48_Vigan66s001400 [Vigna angularis]|uniref:Uncharacterized protein n=1 Tax=Phaseolus angularis TaxID=3914 RepID=A0A0L9T4G5_PHAAN|nr:hypothetical protein LR48_Vigan66s001400 [Vigna angularis]
MLVAYVESNAVTDPPNSVKQKTTGRSFSGGCTGTPPSTRKPLIVFLCQTKNERWRFGVEEEPPENHPSTRGGALALLRLRCKNKNDHRAFCPCRVSNAPPSRRREREIPLCADTNAPLIWVILYKNQKIKKKNLLVLWRMKKARLEKEAMEDEESSWRRKKKRTKTTDHTKLSQTENHRPQLRRRLHRNTTQHQKAVDRVPLLDEKRGQRRGEGRRKLSMLEEEEKTLFAWREKNFLVGQAFMPRSTEVVSHCVKCTI